MNGKNLGRFWNDEGPQMSLFLPAPWMKPGDNEILVFEEFGGLVENKLLFTKELILKGENEPVYPEKSALKQNGIWFELNGEKIQCEVRF